MLKPLVSDELRTFWSKRRISRRHNNNHGTIQSTALWFIYTFDTAFRQCLTICQHNSSGFTFTGLKYSVRFRAVKFSYVTVQLIFILAQSFLWQLHLKMLKKKRKGEQLLLLQCKQWKDHGGFGAGAHVQTGWESTRMTQVILYISCVLYLYISLLINYFKHLQGFSFKMRIYFWATASSADYSPYTIGALRMGGCALYAICALPMCPPWEDIRAHPSSLLVLKYLGIVCW